MRLNDQTRFLLELGLGGCEINNVEIRNGPRLTLGLRHHSTMKDLFSLHRDDAEFNVILPPGHETI